MKKLFLISFLALGVVFGFNSCGDDDSGPDLSVKDTSSLRGTYIGECKVTLLSLANREPIVLKQVSVILSADGSNSQIFNLQTNEFDTQNRLITNFSYVSTAMTDIQFSMGAITRKGLEGGYIGSYVTEWFAEDFTSIDKIDIVCDRTSGKYIQEGNKLQFTYDKVKLKIYATAPVGSVVRDHVIRYEYTVAKADK